MKPLKSIYILLQQSRIRFIIELLKTLQGYSTTNQQQNAKLYIDYDSQLSLTLICFWCIKIPFNATCVIEHKRKTGEYVFVIETYGTVKLYYI